MWEFKKKLVEFSLLVHEPCGATFIEELAENGDMKAIEMVVAEGRKILNYLAHLWDGAESNSDHLQRVVSYL